MYNNNKGGSNLVHRYGTSSTKKTKIQYNTIQKLKTQKYIYYGRDAYVLYIPCHILLL